MLMTFLNTATNREVTKLPPLPDVSNPSWDDYYGRGWRKVIPFRVPNGMEIIPETRRLEESGNDMQEVHSVWTTADARAAAQQVQMLELATTAKAAGGLITALQANLQQLGHSLPANADDVIAAVMQASLMGKLTPEQIEAKHDAIAVYVILDKKGLDNEAINAVWQFMQSQS